MFIGFTLVHQTHKYVSAGGYITPPGTHPKTISGEPLWRSLVRNPQGDDFPHAFAPKHDLLKGAPGDVFPQQTEPFQRPCCKTVRAPLVVLRCSESSLHVQPQKPGFLYSGFSVDGTGTPRCVCCHFFNMGIHLNQLTWGCCYLRHAAVAVTGRSRFEWWGAIPPSPRRRRKDVVEEVVRKEPVESHFEVGDVELWIRS